jgi:hypothetical protein
MFQTYSTVNFSSVYSRTIWLVSFRGWHLNHAECNLILVWHPSRYGYYAMIVVPQMKLCTTLWHTSAQVAALTILDSQGDHWTQGAHHHHHLNENSSLIHPSYSSTPRICSSSPTGESFVLATLPITLQQKKLWEANEEEVDTICLKPVCQWLSETFLMRSSECKASCSLVDWILR